MELNRNKVALIGLATTLAILAVFFLLRTGRDDHPSEAPDDSADSRSGRQAGALDNPDESDPSGSRKSGRPPANHAPPPIVTTESGLQYSIQRAGNGPRPGPNDRVMVSYIGKLDDGTVIDDSYERGHPSTFPLSGVIKGWREGLQLMKVGSKFQLIIPPDLGYGESGRPKIPGNSTLTFDIELLEIAEPKKK